MTTKLPKPPAHLGRSGKRLWRKVVSTFDLDAVALELLATTAAALDRSEQAREHVTVEGLTVVDRFGQTRPHPLLAVERDSRAQFMAGLRALALDLEPVGAIGRPAGR